MTTTAAIRDRLAARGITPAALPLDEAAAYVGLSKRTFLKEVAAGKMPPPLDVTARRKLFSRAALDQRVNPAQAAARPLRDAIEDAIDGYAP